jgi:phosphate transport system permease protein
LATPDDTRGATQVARLPQTPKRETSSALADAIFKNLTRLAALVVFSLLAAILVTLVAGGSLSIQKFGAAFIYTEDWDPVKETFGALVPIYGTLVTALIAMVIGVPVSFGIALFLTELSPKWLKRPLGTAIELLAAIPSIIYGMWGLFVFAPLFADYVQPLMIKILGNIPGLGFMFAGPPIGIGMFTAGLILSIMVIPFITAVMRDVFELVPPMLKESAYGLGSTKWEVMWRVVLPYTKVGVVGGVMLGLGRALGETMAVTFVIGNAHRLSGSLFAPGNSIASALANEFTEAVGDLYPSALIELGLILFMITLIVLAISKFMLAQLAKQEGGRS